MGLVKSTAEILAKIEGEEPDHATGLAYGRRGRLTIRQCEVLGVIEEYARTNDGVTPTDGELAGVLGVSVSTARDHRLTLAEKGAIQIERSGTRTIRLVDRGADL